MTETARRSRVRPARPFTPFPVSIVILLVWWVVAHNSGSGWVQVLGDAVFGMLLVGLFAPAAILLRTRVRVAHAPSDGAADLPSLIRVQASGRIRIKPIDPSGSETFIGPISAGTENEVILIPQRRGVHHRIQLEISTAAPFGLQWWTRRIAEPLEVALHVAPKMGQSIPIPPWMDERDGSLGAALPAVAGDARGVRPYRPGDRRASVHWVASAHAGRLMVRELEVPSTQPVTLKVSLPAGEEASERVAENALATAVHLLDRCVPLVLMTDEVAGTIFSPVSDRREVGRRLARAIAGESRPAVEILP